MSTQQRALKVTTAQPSVQVSRHKSTDLFQAFVGWNIIGDDDKVGGVPEDVKTILATALLRHSSAVFALARANERIVHQLFKCFGWHNGDLFGIFHPIEFVWTDQIAIIEYVFGEQQWNLSNQRLLLYSTDFARLKELSQSRQTKNAIREQILEDRNAISPKTLSDCFADGLLASGVDGGFAHFFFAREAARDRQLDALFETCKVMHTSIELVDLRNVESTNW